MKRSFVTGVLLLVVAVTAGSASLATTYPRFSPTKQWAFIELVRQTDVNGRMLPPGQYLLLHDYGKEARGEPCTSLYTVGKWTEEPGAELVAFHCLMKDRPKAERMTLITDTIPGNTGDCALRATCVYDKLIEFQFAGDAVGHVVPEAP